MSSRPGQRYGYGSPRCLFFQRAKGRRPIEGVVRYKWWRGWPLFWTIAEGGGCIAFLWFPILTGLYVGTLDDRICIEVCMLVFKLALTVVNRFFIMTGVLSLGLGRSWLGWHLLHRNRLRH